MLGQGIFCGKPQTFDAGAFEAEKRSGGEGHAARRDSRRGRRSYTRVRLGDGLTQNHPDGTRTALTILLSAAEPSMRCGVVREPESSWFKDTMGHEDQGTLRGE